ncbi:MAG: hypothetical protein K2K94_09575 [Muribaculaceae bacterium]|nr:hypothetical protein [Muribaculaceae bacterium]
MKSSLIIALLAIVTSISSCSDSKSPYHDQVIAAARRDANKVAQASPGSMEREQAVLAIRVRQHALSANGLEPEAELYYTTAHHILVDSLHIINSRQIDDSSTSNQ